MPPRAPAAVVTASLAALTTAAALGLGRVFATGRFVLPVLGVILVVHGIGFVARMRGWSAFDVVVLWVVALVAYAIWALTPGSTSFGVPTPDTISTISTHLVDGFDELRNAIVPARVTDGAIMLAVITVWTVAVAGELLAFWRRTTIAAMAPALALFIWTAALGTDKAGTLDTLAFAVAALAFLLLAQQQHVSTGRAQFAGRQLGAGSGLLGVGATLGAVALLAGLLVGSALPGADAEPLLDLQGLGKESTQPDSRSYRTEPPLARIGADLSQEQPVDLFTVRSAQPEYWRIAALDVYESTNGGEWTLTASGSDEVEEGLPGKAPQGALVQDYEIGSLEGRWIPAAYEAVEIEGTTPLVVKASRTLVTGREGLRSLQYTVKSVLPPGAQAPISDEQAAGTDTALPKGFAQYTELPSDFPADVKAEAARIVQGASTPYAQAAALERYFLDPANGFQYSLETDLSSAAQSEAAISRFLQEKRGYCVQFAGSFAAMARAVGLPTRVAVGFTTGEFVAGPNWYTVTSHDAHAWPEVYLGGLGWVRFEPTPPSEGPGGSDLPGRQTAAPPDPSAGSGTGTATSTPAGQSEGGRTTATTTAAGAGQDGAGAGSGSDVSIDTADPDDGGGSGLLPGWELFLWLGIALVVAAVGAAGAILVAKARRTRLRRAAGDPDSAIAGAWQEVLERLGEAGILPDLARTPLELAEAAPPLLPERAVVPLADLARTYTAATYGRAPADDQLADEAWRDVAAVSAALRESASVTERWRRRLDPSALRG
jgi:transglutaminase-like putative cysteine protease